MILWLLLVLGIAPCLIGSFVISITDKTDRRKIGMDYVTGMLVMLAILVALAVWRMGDLSQRWPVVAVLIAACAVFALCGTGITGRGVIGGGRQITFARAAYYTIEGENTETPTFRISRITRELSLNVAKEDVPRIRALMEENGVATFEEFQEKVEKKTRSRQNAQHKKKKKK